MYMPYMHAVSLAVIELYGGPMQGSWTPYSYPTWGSAIIAGLNRGSGAPVFGHESPRTHENFMIIRALLAGTV
jgi:hypothetical protein